MIRTYILACELKRERTDALNRESGRIYTQVLVEHFRIYRKHGIWLKVAQAEKLNDAYNAERSPLLHSHSIDAAQQGFYEACKTANALKKAGDEQTKYPHWRKAYRSTTWKKTGIRVKDSVMVLSLARGQEPIRVPLPEILYTRSIVQVELVYHKAGRQYHWHLTTDDAQVAEPTANTAILAGDLGEIHPCALSDGEETVIVTNRELRATKQYGNKRLAALRSEQSRYQHGSRRWWKVQRRLNRFLAQQEQKTRDLLHKTSHEIVEVAKEKKSHTIVLGNVRDIGKGKRLPTKTQQKISQWSHGQLRDYITYKAKAVGMHVVDDVNEAYSSQTCTSCTNRYKPRGRIYRCPRCGLVAHRDGIGAVNILSKYIHGEVGKIAVPHSTKYRIPHNTRVLRSPAGTGQVARDESDSSSS